MSQPAQHKKPTRYLRPQEKLTLEQTVRDFEAVANSPYVTGEHSRKQARDAAARARKDLETQTAPDLSATERDRFDKRRKVLEEQIQKDMLSDEEMRRNPHGATDHHIRWERANKAAIMEWKNIQIAMHPGADRMDSQDLCNIERLRRHTNPNRNYEDAQIPRSSSTVYSMPPTELGPKAGFPYRRFEELFDDSPERMAAEAEAKLQEMQEKLARFEALQAQHAQRDEQPIEQDISQMDEKPDLTNVKRRPGRHRKD